MALRIIFMGTPDFAVPSLDMLVRNGFEVAAVVTQADKPKGRGNRVAVPAVKAYALDKGIPVLQPLKVKTPEFVAEMKALSPDLFITVAYGRILSKELLEVPPLGCINVHGSLLPKYRGAAPIQWAVINGDRKTGITTMYTDIGMDTGDMLIKKEMEIPEDMTTGQLHDQLALLGAETLKETLACLQEGTLVRVPQKEEEATYAPMMQKDTGLIDWSASAWKIHNLVRGTNPWPGASTVYKGDRMRIWGTRVLEEDTVGAKPGMVHSAGRDGIIVQTGRGKLLVTEVQFDNCRKMCVEDYICGHEIEAGAILGC